MKARCKCGRTFVVRPELEGKRVRCPSCGKVVQLPSSAPPAPPSAKETPKAAPLSAEWEEAFPQGVPQKAGPPGEPSGRKAAVEPDTEAPTRDEEPTQAPKKAEPEFDWGDEFSLEGEEPAAQKPQPSPPAVRQEGPAPAAAPKEETGLAFDSQEFHIDTGGPEEAEEPPVDLGAGQILGIRQEAAPAAPAGQKTQICPQCGRVFTEKLGFCPECGKALGAPAVRKTAEGAPAWAASFWGSFLYAYPAVVVGEGWQSWLRYAAIGAFLPTVVVFIGALTCVGICVAIPLALAIMFGSILGAMYLYMGQAAAQGAAPLENVRPRIVDDMIVPFLMILGSGSVLVIAPMFAAGLAVKVTGAVPFGEIIGGLKGEGEGIGMHEILSLIAASGVLVAGMLFGMFCFPMVVMLLGASQKVSKSVNPINVFRAIAKAPGHYLALWAFFLLNVLATPFLLAATEGMLTPIRAVPFVGAPMIRFVAMAVAIYMASVTGWRMGMFLHTNDKVFDHVK